MKSQKHKKQPDVERDSFTKPSAKQFPIVGIGASAGGLEAFTALLEHLPSDTGMGFVLVQHLDPQHESALTQILSRATSMPVSEVTNNLAVQPNRVYVITPNTKLRIAKGVLKLQPRGKDKGPTRSIDFFLESLAQDQGERAIGVVLSGTATDGTVGLEAIKAGGGITVAQDDSARYDSMPHNAIASGCVDFVLSPEGIAQELARIAKHPYITGQRASENLSLETGDPHTAASNADETPLPAQIHATSPQRAIASRQITGVTGDELGFKKILLLLRNHSGVDFSLYKSNTIQRRVTRRVILTKHSALEDYSRFLKGNAKELDALYSDVLISVTNFFRDREAFDILKHKVFPKILLQRGDDPIRVWVLGCSTGQEAYSIAMTFLEAAESSSRGRKLQVFATDLNDAHLDKARHGLYTKSITEDVSPERLRRFFVEEEAGYRISKPLREMVVFARQNLMSDPPFSRMDLISCRNLLIYLEPYLQKRAIPTFHYALKPEGFLFLGASESISGFNDLFEAVDKKHKIYCRKAAPTQLLSLPVKKEDREPYQPGRRLPLGLDKAYQPSGVVRGEIDSQREADRVSVNQFAPPGVLVNADLQILQFRGPTAAYLQPPPAGKASLDVIKMAREGLMLPLRAAINQAKKQNKSVRRENVRVQQDGATRAINLEVIPLKNLKERFFLILFQDVQSPEQPSGEQSVPAPGGVRPVGKREERRIDRLESDLADTRDYLQAMQEQHEAANEELQASNEEVQSANEELQSVNEELETSKEELESANEELTTVNEEMASRNAELNRLNADLHNLQNITKLPILLLGRDLIIRRFSAPTEKIFNLLATDVGRPLSGVRHNLVVEKAGNGKGEIPSDAVTNSQPNGNFSPCAIEDLIREVIDGVREVEREVRDKDGRWYSMRVRPYITVDNKVDGAVLVLVDITDLKLKEQEIKTARNYAEAIIQTARDPLLILRADMRVNTANEGFYRTFKLTPAQVEGRVFFDLLDGAWRIPKLRLMLEEILTRKSSFNDFEITCDFPEIGRRTMLLTGQRLRLQDGECQFVLLALEDVTERQRADLATASLAAIVNSSDDAIISKDLNGIIKSWNRGAERIFGYTAEEAVGRSVEMLIPKERLAEEPHILSRLKQGERLHHFETVRIRKNGTPIEISLTISPITNAAGEVIGASKIARDITERKRAAEGMRVSEIRYRRLFEAARDGVLILESVSRQITDANLVILQLLGCAREDLLGKELWQIGLLKDEQSSRAAFRELHQNGTIRYENLPVRTKSGGKYEIELVASLYEEGGKEVVQCNIRDTTERERAAEALRESEERYRTLFNLGPVAIYFCDASGVIREFNHRAAELWDRSPAPGHDEEKFCGSVKLFHLDGTLLPHSESPMAKVLSGELAEARDIEALIERPDGSRITVVVNIRAIKDQAGKIMGAINCFYDISERKQVEEALRLAQIRLADRAGQLEQAVAERTTELTATNKQLEAFVYSIAHDLRAPLRSMQGFSSLLVEEAGKTLSEEGQSHARRINKSAQLMDAMLSGLLSFSRVSQQHLELGPVNLEATIESALSQLQKDIQDKHARVERGSGPWPNVLAHEATLVQVLLNLLSNSLKFIPPNVRPVIRLRTEEQAEFVRLWVEDNGIGIAPDHQEQIFRLFARLRGDQYPGTGIGLAIVRKGVERLGGQVGVDSAPNAGSRFWVDLRKAPQV